VAPEADDERALVQRLRRGDPHAFREVYARHAQPTFRFLMRLCGRQDQAEDLHQETWLAVARHAADLAADSDVAAWIFTIARNQFRSAHRRARRVRVPEAPATVIAGHDDPAAHDLERALGALPAVHREILLLVAIEGLAIDQVASILELRPEAARQRLTRARAALVDLLAADDLLPAGNERRGAG
jgi:RNA polymerase sigma-70 factor (ECF subfamily)